MRMSEGMKPKRPERNVWHMEPEDARPDASSEPQPLIASGSVVGLWLVDHLPVVHPHDHAFYEMALVLSGSGFHVCGDSEELVQAGSVVFVPPGVAHGYRACRDMEVYNCFFRAELAEFELLWAARDDALVALFGRGGARRLHDDHVVMQVDQPAFDQCVSELDAIRHEDPSERSHARQIGHLLLALDLIARHGRRYGPTPSEQRLATPRVVSAVLDCVRRGPRSALDSGRPEHRGLRRLVSSRPRVQALGGCLRRWPTSRGVVRNGRGSCSPERTTRSRRSAVPWVGRSLPRSRGSSRRPSGSARASSGGGGGRRSTSMRSSRADEDQSV